MAIKKQNSKDDNVLEYLRQIPETKLHTEIFFPLFKAMGFTHIRYLHGPSERGKDIAYVVKDSYGESQLGVCQIKNEPFSGKAAKTNNTIAVLNQLKQCRDTEVLNPETHLKELPQEVVLFNTYPLPDKDTADARKLLEDLRALKCKIIEPEKLVSLIRRNLPELYSTFAFPGIGLSKSLCAYVNIHREAAAFGIARKRSLANFYVDLGFTNYREFNECTLLEESNESGTTKLPIRKKTSHISKDNILQIHRMAYDSIKNWMSILPNELEQISFIEMVNLEQEGEWLDVKKLRLLEFVHTSKSCIEKLCNSKKIPLIKRAMIIMRVAQYFIPYILSLVEEHPAVGDRAEILNALRDLKIPEIAPEVLLDIDDNMCIIGEAGAGKTSLTRMLILKAVERNIKCIYFPCVLLKGSRTDVRNLIKKFLGSISPSSSSNEVKHFLKDAKLIILDGCDEAEDFGAWLGEEIKTLAFAKNVKEKVSGNGDINIYIPPDLSQKIKVNYQSRNISVVQPLSQLDFERLMFANKGNIGQAIKRIEAKYREQNPRIILTSRIAGPLELSGDFFVTTLKGFSDGQLENFYKKWFTGTNKSYVNVIRFLNKSKYIKEISRLPITATIIAALYENGYDLPHSKSDLYNKRFDLLLDKWQVIKGLGLRGQVKPVDKFVLLMRLALKLHIEHRRRFNREDLKEIWNEGFERLYPDYSYERLLWELQVCNGVIYPEGPSEYTLGHLSYQEFLAANAIMHIQKRDILIEKYFDPWWKNAIIFYAGICGDISTFLEAIHQRHALIDEKGLISDILNEGRFASPVVLDFLREGLDIGIFKEDDWIDDDYFFDDYI